MKIIVTGGAGFIASHVVDGYVAAGHKVVVIDNLWSGSRKNLNPKAKFYKADIRNAAALAKIFAKERPNVVNHHAALISVTDSVKKPHETFQTNVMGTLNVVLAFAAAPGGPKKKLIFSSTGGAIYGNPKKLPADESTPPNPFSPYAVAKHIDEEIINYFCKVNNIPYVILRYANVYGPRQRSQAGAGIFPTFITQIKKGVTPTIFGNGGKARDYVFVEDVAHASVLAISRGKNEIINIATTREISDRAVYDAIAKALKFNKAPHFAPARKGEVQRISMSYAKAKKILGWEPKVSFEEGAKKTVRSF